MADFHGDDLRGSRFHDVDLSGAYFRVVDLTGVVMRGVEMGRPAAAGAAARVGRR
jgi:uncharacterized protein YjbI with pentapeptide repeats